MNYEIVELEEKHILGLNARTSNTDPQMGPIIGGLWQRLFSEKLYEALPHKINDCTICLYSDYESDATGTYDVTVGCEVSSDASSLAPYTLKTIPKGRYAKFILTGDSQKTPAIFWSKLWKMDLARNYNGDFEEYHPTQNPNECEIHFYIALS